MAVHLSFKSSSFSVGWRSVVDSKYLSPPAPCFNKW